MQVPIPLRLEGEHVCLELLSLDHLDAMCAVGLDDALWTWSPKPIRSRADMATYIREAVDGQVRGEMLPFATIERRSEAVVGSTRFGNIDVANHRLEIGWTWVARPWQRTAVNTEAKLLMLRHAFDSLGVRRVELKTDVLNRQSREAILRLGAKEEGVFRKHMATASGRIRDTVYFSIIEDEWPEVKIGLEAKLARRDQ